MNFKPLAYHHKTIVKGFALLWKLNCYQGQSSLLREAEARLHARQHFHCLWQSPSIVSHKE